jgi:5'-methylthioadenosine phosphorylase
MFAIIGGTGLYDLNGLHIEERLSGDTPFGAASGEVLKGQLHGTPVLFLARHGSGHRLMPHEVNYRANIFALKQAGATQLLGFSAVGSLHIDIAPGDLAMPEQYVDWTRGLRERTFFGQGVAAHVSTAKPVSPGLVDAAMQSAQGLGIRIHRGLTYACVDGPRLGTQAESNFLRQMGCHLVGMTNAPEVFLAREAQMAYATMGIVTDYDCWLEDPAQHVSVAGIFELYGKSLENARRVLDGLLRAGIPQPDPQARTALSTAMLTPESALTDAQRTWMQVLQR